MKRNFIFTEEQIKRFVDRKAKQCCKLEEEDELNIAYKKPANGQATTSDMKQQIINAKKQAPNSNVNLVVGGEDLNESKQIYTKKQLKEAKLKMLRDNSVTMKKKDLFKK